MMTRTLILRPRLLDLVEQPELAPITLVTAPAGYGKSTLVDQWAHATCRRVARLALGQDANTPHRFVAQLVAAIENALPDPDASFGGNTSDDSIASALDAVSRDGHELTIVVDDYHLIENQEVHDAMDGLLAILPDTVHVMLLSRTIPPVSLGRLQAEGLVRHLTEDHLSFTTEEVEAVVGHTAPDLLTESQIATLGERTEGWIAGIRLALLSMERVDANTAQMLIDTWPASRWLDGYFVEEVLSSLPEDVRDFVLKTVILTELTPALCNETLGIDTSARLMDEVRQRLVFVRPAGTSGDALTYHALFAESVGRIAERAWPEPDRRERHRRAARWYERQGELESAIDHAVAAGDWEIAERCIRPLCRMLMDSDNHHSRLHWLGKLPEARVLADPDLARGYVSALIYTGQVREAQRAFAVVDSTWRASGDPVQLGYSAITRCAFVLVTGDADLAMQLAEEALAQYPPDHAVDRMHAWTVINQAAFFRADDQLAEHAHHQAELCLAQLPAEQWWWTAHTALTRANQQALRGNLRIAHDMYQVALDDLPAIYRSLEPKIRARLAAILLEWNDLDAAERQLDAVRRDLDAVPRQIWHLYALVVMTRLHAATGDTEELVATRRRLRTLHNQNGGNSVLTQLEALQAPTWLQSGRPGMAREWAARTEALNLPWTEIFGDDDPRLTVAQIQIADGQHTRVEAWLGEIIEQATARKRWAEIVPLSMWHAVACIELGDEEKALASLRTALQHGMPGGFVRSFMTPGYDLTSFLLRVQRHLSTEASAYLHRVAVAQAHPGAVTGPLPRSLPARAVIPAPSDPGFPLSSRELEVLALVYQGRTNLEIADALYITERTVKKHISNSLRKLKVPNRTMAVVRAMELDLLTL